MDDLVHSLCLFLNVLVGVVGKEEHSNPVKSAKSTLSQLGVTPDIDTTLYYTDNSTPGQKNLSHSLALVELHCGVEQVREEEGQPAVVVEPVDVDAAGLARRTTELLDLLCIE